MQKIIIDGYNVIHADPDLLREAGRAMESAREALLARLRAYLSSRKVQITVVFDGAGGMVDAESPVPGRLQVLYSASGQSADEVIVETLRRHANPREYIVVTSDMADIGRAVSAVGATVMPSSAFLERVSATGGAPEEESPATGEKPEPSADDVDYWLKRFGKTGDQDD